MPKVPQKQKNTFLVRIGKNIHRYRVMQDGMTQEDLADAIGSNSTYISKIETGTADGLTLVMLEKFARALKVSVADLIDENLPSSERKSALFLGEQSLSLYAISKQDRKVAEKIFMMMIKALRNEEK